MSSERAFHLMAKPTGAVCNLDCDYCFYLSKQAMYPEGTFRMTPELVEAYVRQLLDAHAGQKEVVVAWQGGEPTLMGLEFFERAVRIVEQYRRPGQRVVHTLQTNGIKLDERWGRFLRRHGFLVGLSIDGPRHLHDAYRLDKSGAGSFEQVLAAYRLLQRNGVELNVLCTVHAVNQDAPLEIYRFFRDQLGVTFLQFIPIVQRRAPELLQLGGRARAVIPMTTEVSVDPEGYGRFLIAVFEEWVRRDVGRVFVQMFDATLANWVGAPPTLCVFAETCGNALVLEHNGDVYSCDHFVDGEHRLGNIEEAGLASLVSSERQRQFGLAKRDGLPEYCRACDVRFACNGGCPKDRFARTATGDPGLNYLCAGYQAFFRHVRPAMEFMARELAAGRPPANVMAHLAHGEPHAPRPDHVPEECACGSGRPFLACHGAHEIEP